MDPEGPTLRLDGGALPRARRDPKSASYRCELQVFVIDPHELEEFTLL